MKWYTIWVMSYGLPEPVMESPETVAIFSSKEEAEKELQNIQTLYPTRTFKIVEI